MTARFTWLFFTLVSATILAAAGWLGATVWEQDAREQRAGTLALWEQKVQAALWRMDAAASALVAREAARRPEEFAVLARGGAPLQDRPAGPAAAREKSEKKALDRSAPTSLADGGALLRNDPAAQLESMPPAVAAAPPAPALSAPPADPPAAENKRSARYFSKSLSSESDPKGAPRLKAGAPALAHSPPAQGVAFAPATVQADAAPGEMPPPLPGAPAAVAEAAKAAVEAPAAAPERADDGGDLAALARRLPALKQAAQTTEKQAPVYAPRDQALQTADNGAQAQLAAQVGNSYRQRSAAKDAIYGNLGAQAEAVPEQARGLRDSPAVGALTALAENRDLVLARRVGTPGHETVQGVRLSAAAVSDELLALVRGDFPAARLEPEYASPPPNLARTLAALPLRFDPGETPVLVVTWTPVRSAVSVAGAALLVALGAVALLLARTLALSERRAAFVSTMTHELRTPLTTFRLYTDLLETAPQTADRARYTQVLAREAERLSHLVENVLAYARLERGRSKPVPKAQGVGELLAPAIDRLRERAERAGFTLEVMPHDAGLTVRADTATVEQILLNLVDNAGKYAVAADDRRLVLTADKRGITLRDFGPGLDPVMQKRLFTPFSRSDKEAAGNAPGVGLGLALCRRLAREMGGDLVHKKAEPGAEFTLVLGEGRL